MDSTHNISEAGLYTDFSGLQRLRSKAGSQLEGQSNEATKEVAKQFESLFLQMMLKSMRDATPTDGSTESDQTRFYQEMFDKQIALDLANNEKGQGLGIAAMLQRDLTATQPHNLEKSPDSQTLADDFELIHKQVIRAGASIQTDYNQEHVPEHIPEHISGQE